MKTKETVCIGEKPFLKEMLEQCLELKNKGYRIIAFLQAETKEDIDFEREFRSTCDELFIELKSNSPKNTKTAINSLKELLKVIEQSTHTEYPESIYIFCLEPTAKDLERLAQEHNIKSITYSKK